MAAATRAAPLSAGERPRLSPSRRASPRPRAPREEGAAAEEAGPSGREERSKNFIHQTRLERTPSRPSPRRGARGPPAAPRAAGAAASGFQACLRAIPSTRGCLLCRGHTRAQNYPEVPAIPSLPLGKVKILRIFGKACVLASVRFSPSEPATPPQSWMHARSPHPEGLKHRDAGLSRASGGGEGGSVTAALPRRRWPRSAAGGAGVVIAEPRRSRAPRRVVAGPFQERGSAGSPPGEDSRGSFFLLPQPIPVTAAPDPACREDAGSPAWRVFGPGGVMRAPGSGDPSIISQNASGHGLGRGAKGHRWCWAAFPSSYSARIGAT